MQIIVARSLGSLSGFEGESVAVTGEVSHPCLVALPHGRLLCGYSEEGVFKAVASDDDGATWLEPEVQMEGTYGRIWCNDGGDMMRAVIRADGPVRLYSQFRGCGDPDWGDEVELAEAGMPIAMADDVFGLAYDYGTGGWMIYARREGESDRSVFFSLDNGATWREI